MKGDSGAPNGLLFNQSVVSIGCGRAWAPGIAGIDLSGAGVDGRLQRTRWALSRSSTRFQRLKGIYRRQASCATTDDS